MYFCICVFFVFLSVFVFAFQAYLCIFIIFRFPPPPPRLLPLPPGISGKPRRTAPRALRSIHKWTLTRLTLFLGVFPNIDPVFLPQMHGNIFLTLCTYQVGILVLISDQSSFDWQWSQSSPSSHWPVHLILGSYILVTLLVLASDLSGFYQIYLSRVRHSKQDEREEVELMD